MRDVPGWVESMRQVILMAACGVLILRIPGLRYPSQRPALMVLFVVATGSVAIQLGIGRWIDGVTGIPKAGELLVALVALTDFATVWWFAVRLQSADRPVPTWLRRAPLLCAATMAALAVAFFFVTPVPDRFGAQAHGWWQGYVIAWITYGSVTAIGAGVVFWRYGLAMRTRVLRISVLALAVGALVELPYLAVRAVRWFDADAPPILALVGFWFSFTRFILVALGCSLAALVPLGKVMAYWYRRQRLYDLWVLLHRTTPESDLRAPPSRLSDLLTFGKSWERLHQRVIDIHDAITLLHNRRASPRLLREASAYASRLGGQEHLMATACWIEAARRRADAGTALLHHEPNGELLPETSDSTGHQEIRRLVQLYRALRSEPVRSFADGVFVANAAKTAD